MTIRAVGIFSIVFAAAACAPASQTARTAIAPKDGPKVTLYASYTGGLFDRSVYAYFNVDRPSYVLIGHLSGEGYIEVLYPASPKHQTQVAEHKSIRTTTFYAPYDGLPMETARRGVIPIRDLSSRIDSYDGRGHAYIFAIVSERPLHFDDISEGALWNDVDVPNYIWNPDPRRSIKDFADAVTRGEPYTLRFASSYTTTTFTSYADAAWTCSMLSQLSLAALHSLGFYRPGVGSDCGVGAYSLFDLYFFRARPYDYAYIPSLVTTTPAVPPRRPDSTATDNKPGQGMPAVQLLPAQKRVRLSDRVQLLGDAEEEFNQPTRADLSPGTRALIAPRRAVDEESPRMNTFDQRRRTYGSAAGSSEGVRADRVSTRSDGPRAERSTRQVERAESPRSSGSETHVERPQVERSSPPAPRAEPRSSTPPPRPQAPPPQS